MPSSSGDEESYDSRAESSSISAFLNNSSNPPQTHVGPFTTPPPPGSSSTSANHHLLLTPRTPMLFDPPLSPYLDPIQRSTNNTNITSPPPLLSLDAAWSAADLDRLIGPGAAPSFPTTTPPPHTQNGMARNPKKRSRASRRAPTTVLTTDTSNFRAMVQEFTGVPAQPFTSSSFPRTAARLDLLGSSNFLRPPLVPQPSPLIIPAVNSSPSLLVPNGCNMHNGPIFSFQAPQPPRHPAHSLPPAASASLDIPPPQSTVDLKMGGVLEELGLTRSHARVGGGLHNVANSSSPSRVVNNHNNNGSYGSSGAIQDLDQDQERVVSNGKVNNYAPSPSDFHHGAAPRGQGMVESWINCSSD